MNSTTKFKTGDRVAFVDTYAGRVSVGDQGTVKTSYISDSSEYVKVELDNGKHVPECYASRLKLIPKSYEFKLGDKGKTRDGRDYEVIAVDVRLGQPVIAIIAGKSVSHHSIGGNYWMDGDKSRNDLMPPSRERVIYLNVYDGSVAPYKTEDAARLNAQSTALVVAHKVVIEIPA